jgi:uncharacterized membrane protein YhaH (DUF805 family)
VAQQVLGLGAFFVMIGPLLLSMFWTSANMLVLFIVLFSAALLPGSSLVVRRGHDLGWPAIASLILALVPASLVALLVLRFGGYFRSLENAPWIESATRMPTIMIVFAGAAACSFWLTFKEGPHTPNRYGPAPG